MVLGDTSRLRQQEGTLEPLLNAQLPAHMEPRLLQRVLQWRHQRQKCRLDEGEQHQPRRDQHRAQAASQIHCFRMILLLCPGAASHQ